MVKMEYLSAKGKNAQGQVKREKRLQLPLFFLKFLLAYSWFPMLLVSGVQQSEKLYIIYSFLDSFLM